VRRVAHLPVVVIVAVPFLASCADDERSPFDASADRDPPQLAAFEIVQQDQRVYAAWSASEPARAVIEYSSPADGLERHGYPENARDWATAGTVKLVGVTGSTDYVVSGVRLTDRAGNSVTAEPADGAFTTGPVAADPLLSFTMIDVGWGDALYLETPDGRNVLIDAGHPRERDARPPLKPGSNSVRTHPVRWFLERRGITSLDFASLSHVHEDHIGGFYGDSFGECTDGLLNNYVSVVNGAETDSCPSLPIAVGTFLDILDKTPGSINGPYLDLLETLQFLEAAGRLERHVFLGSGESSLTEASLQWGADLRVDLLAAGRKDYLLPDYILGAETGSVQNNDSMVYRVQYGSFVMILMGDGEFATEQYLQDHYPPEFLRTTMLKLGHHGSNDANSERWIRTADPVVAFVPNAVSENPGVEHPFVLNRLRNLGIDYYASDRVLPNRERSLPGVRGDVHLLTDGGAFTVLVDNVLYE
jgi:beta-lactamase superfamily II metal-dependent hydrolase